MTSTQTVDWWEAGYWDGYGRSRDNLPDPGASESVWDLYDAGHFTGQRDRMREKD